tara:strand:- start:5465 stop:5998 length:534 start_codon:yes stop_codon:yes gene_type:complete
MSDIVAQGVKVLIREKRFEDGEDDHSWRANPELAELDAAMPIRQSLKDFLRDYENELKFPTPWVRRYGIDSLEGVHIGNCMVYDIDTIGGQCEIGILVGDKNYWSKGYGREAVKLLIDECFKMENMKRLYLHTLTWNARARRAFAGCGFKEVQQVRRAGRDFILMEIYREEWLRIKI